MRKLELVLVCLSCLILGSIGGFLTWTLLPPRIETIEIPSDPKILWKQGPIEYVTKTVYPSIYHDGGFTPIGELNSYISKYAGKNVTTRGVVGFRHIGCGMQSALFDSVDCVDVVPSWNLSLSLFEKLKGEVIQVTGEFYGAYILVFGVK